MTELLDSAGDNRERRGNRRFAGPWLGTVARRDMIVSCVILNVSAGGAALRLQAPIESGSMILLWSPRFGTFPAKVVWNRGPAIGIGFLESAAEVVERLAPFVSIDRDRGAAQSIPAAALSDRGALG